MESPVTNLSYDRDTTALVAVDPYKDFISEGGKIWPRIKAVAAANNCVPHMQQVLQAACDAKLRVFFAMQAGTAPELSGFVIAPIRQVRRPE
jgi:hypothetical protein